jgi:hypothetical protein
MYAYYLLHRTRVGVVTDSATLTGGPGDGSLTEGSAALTLDVGMTLPDVTRQDGPLPDMLRPRVPDNRAPQHCGAPMEWRSPEPPTLASYSFDPAGQSVSLPALWRCRCGFQLDSFQFDGADQGAAGLVAASWQSR